MPIRRLRTPRKLNTLLHNPEADGAQASRTANPQRASTSTPQASGVEDTLL